MDKLSRLEELLKDLGRVAIAFSGGVDSSLLLFVAARALPGRVLAITCSSPFQTKDEIDRAGSFANELGVPHQIAFYEPLRIERIKHNYPDRCYFCKRELFTKALEVASNLRFTVLIDGTNADDMKEYRPGLQALRELGITSPFARLNIGKDWIRHVSREFKLSPARVPSNACLATRVHYYVHLTEDLLRRISEGENMLKSYGFSKLRLRTNGTIVCIEVPASEIGRFWDKELRTAVVSELKRLGFVVISVDLEGLVSGKLDRVIPRKHRAPFRYQTIA